MSEKERITQPTEGSNPVGDTTPETRGKGMPAGTDTQTRLAAMSAQQKKEEEEQKSENLPIERANDLPAKNSNDDTLGIP